MAHLQCFSGKQGKKKKKKKKVSGVCAQWGKKGRGRTVFELTWYV